MALRASVERVLAQGVQRVEEELTAVAHQRARAAGVPDDQATSIYVVFRDSAFVAESEHDGFLEREYGRPGMPPLGLLRRLNRELPHLAGPLLDKHVGGVL